MVIGPLQKRDANKAVIVKKLLQLLRDPAVNTWVMSLHPKVVQWENVEGRFFNDHFSK